MTGDARRGLGPLGRRLLAAFVAVALSSVLVLTLAALVGTDRGLSAARQAEQQEVANRTAELVAVAYLDAGGWSGVDLAAAQGVADAAGAWLMVRDQGAGLVRLSHRMGAHHRVEAPAGGHASEAPVVADGEQIGTVRLVFGLDHGPDSGLDHGPGSGPGGPGDGGDPGTVAGATSGAGVGRTVAWSWVVAAAVVALLVALAASWFVSRRLAAPLVRMAAAAGRFAAGDRTVRSGVRAPGELGEVARAFDAMADEVVRAEAVRRQLAADVAHELRTPLAGLQAGLEEVRDGLADPDPARLASLHDQALRLGRVVDDLADLSAAESAALSLRRTDVDLAALVGSVVATQQPMLRAAGLEVASDLSGPVPVCADADRVHQAVVNLLANAARYCRAGDRVVVRVSAEDGMATVAVADTGPGIAPDDLPHVFQRLRRGSGSRGVTGSGIGLAVVRELVAAHGGTVTVGSSPAVGTTFTIRLPLHTTSIPAAPVLHSQGRP